jgi:hypothetical protein
MRPEERYPRAADPAEATLRETRACLGEAREPAGN